jgi:hypothetical protein
MRQVFLKRIDQLSRAWWLFYAVGVNALVVTTALFEQRVPLGVLATATVINYAHVFLPSARFPVEWVIVGGITVGAVLFAVKKRFAWYGLGLFLLPFGLFILYAFLASPRLFPLEWEFQSAKHLETEHSGDYAFNLLRHEKWAIDRPDITYNLYQCDSASAVCDLIYRQKVGPNIIDLAADSEKPAYIDVREGEIFMYVEGKLVYQQAVS